MALSVTPTQSNVLAALRAFLLNVLPATAADGTPVSVIAAQANRVAEPAGTSFVVMTPIRFDRLATNLDTSADVKFSASIAGNTMAVSAVQLGTIGIGATVWGTGVQAGTNITALAGGTGGVGNYTIAPSQ